MNDPRDCAGLARIRDPCSGAKRVGVVADDPLVGRAVVERFVGAFESVGEASSGSADLAEPTIQFGEHGLRLSSPARDDMTVGVDQRGDLGERESGQLEQVDECDLVDGPRCCRCAYPRTPPDRAQQPFRP